MFFQQPWSAEEGCSQVRCGGRSEQEEQAESSADAGYTYTGLRTERSEGI